MRPIQRQEPLHTGWADGVIRALVNAAVTIGGYNATALNHVSRWEAVGGRQSFGVNFERLAELKAKYDPGNLFRGSLSLQS